MRGEIWRNQPTDNVLQFTPVVVYKLLVGHGQQLMVQRCEIKSRDFHCNEAEMTENCMKPHGSK